MEVLNAIKEVFEASHVYVIQNQVHILSLLLILIGSVLWFFQQKFDWFLWFWGMQHLPKIMFVYATYTYIPSWHAFDWQITAAVWIFVAEIIRALFESSHREKRFVHE